MNRIEADCVVGVGGIRVNTFSTTTWNILRLWQCKGSKSGRNEVTSKLDVAEFRTRKLCCSMCLQKSQASADLGVAESFVCNQARKIWMLRWQVLWLMSLSPSFPCPSVRNRSFSAPNHDASCPPSHGCSWSAGAWTRFQLSTCFSDTRYYWPRKPDVQGTFKAKSFYEATTWTSYSCDSCDIEIISKTRWSEPELGKLLRWPCRDSSGFLNLHGNSTVFSERWLGGLWSIDLLKFSWFKVCVSKNWHKLHKHNFAAHWFPSIGYWQHSFGFIWQTIILYKNIWSEIEMIKCHYYCTWYWGLKVKLPQCGSNFTTSWLPCEVKSAFGWWVRFWRAGIEHGKSLCKTNTDWFLLLKVNS